MSRVNLESALTALQAAATDTGDPRVTREWASGTAQRLERILATPVNNQPYFPQRGDSVGQYLRRWRDQAALVSVAAGRAVDAIIDDYQLRADAGTDLLSTLPSNGG
jgi:hypothetical protein